VLVEDLPVAPELWSLGLRRLGLGGVVDVVPAAETVLVTCREGQALARVIERLHEVEGIEPEPETARTVTIPVRYDGDDLIEVAAAVDLDVDDLIALHSGADYRAAFCGFAPGFAYLRGLPRQLHLPRRSTPRTSVPRGAVAIASEFSAVYPRSSPGGWHIIGSTSVVMFDPDREPAALIEPGTEVRFVPA